MPYDMVIIQPTFGKWCVEKFGPIDLYMKRCLFQTTTITCNHNLLMDPINLLCSQACKQNNNITIIIK